MRSIELFSRDLRRLGHEVYIFAPDYPECSDEAYIYRFSSVPAPSAPGFRIPIPYRPNIMDKVKKLDLDIVHSHSPFLMGRLASAVSRKTNLPLVFTYHTRYEAYVHYLPFGRKPARRLTKKYTLDYCSKCDLVIAPTSYVKRYLREDCYFTPIEVVPTGVDLDRYEHGNPHWMRRRYRFAATDKVLLYVGRLGEEKNLHFLLETVKDLMAQKDNLYLMVVGGGPDEKEFRELIQSWQLEHRIIFSGMVSPRKVIDYYLGADLFVFPSVTETQGLVTLEAMAAGLPVIAMDREGPAEVINDGVDGLLIPPKKGAFKKAINRILDDQEYCQKMGQAAIAKARALSSMAMAKKMETVYNQLREKKSNNQKKDKTFF